MPLTGWDCVTVPGCVSAWVALSKRFGRLPFRDLFQSAIHYAEDGFLVSPETSKLWQAALPRLQNFPDFVKTFCPKGRAPFPGNYFNAHN
jgi:gamma-glutamyltranspeptidase/glutathione hydrolase